MLFNKAILPQIPSFSLLHMNDPHSGHARKKDYIFKNTLGKGGYAEVKLAWWISRQMDVAVKIIDKRAVDRESQIKRHHLVTALDHPHCIKLYEWFESKTKFYMTFELASGGELFDLLIKRGRFSEDEAKRVTRGLISALSYIHSRDIIHRDIKLENVLYRTPASEAGPVHSDCMISDFGLSSIVDPNARLHSVCGSAGYTAPEVYTPEGYSFPADCWSMGVLVFALLGGRFPYTSTEPLALAREARTTELYFPRTWDAISTEAKDFVKSLLEVNPAKRMTAKEALNHPWLADIQPPEPAAPPAETTPTSEIPPLQLDQDDQESDSSTPSVHVGPAPINVDSTTALPNEPKLIESSIKKGITAQGLTGGVDLERRPTMFGVDVVCPVGPGVGHA